jgi:hypothetical protein
MRVGTMVISEGLGNPMSQEQFVAEHREKLNFETKKGTTYRTTRFSFGILDFLLLRMKEEALTRPPRRRENNDKLSRTLVMGWISDRTEKIAEGSGSKELVPELVMADTVPGASCDGLLGAQQRSATYLSMIPDFHDREPRDR